MKEHEGRETMNEKDGSKSKCYLLLVELMELRRPTPPESSPSLASQPLTSK